MLALLTLMAANQLTTPKVGMVITKSVKIAKGDYMLAIDPGKSDQSPAIVIRGDNIIVDFQGAVLRGTPVSTLPDQRRGTGIEVRGKNILIMNVTVRGYKNGLVARESPDLTILDSDFSYNWKQHLGSTLEREDLSDWMSYHRNDHDEWLLGDPDQGIPAYGGAIYLSACDRFVVKNCTAVGGENGLMLNRCNDGKAWNNNFSFLSAIGVGLYRSSRNRIMHNSIDWCVRGYSHGVYNRGQDSAGILVYEQSNENTFAYNSVTHGGDGFFLWAGQTTMEDGSGGCNDNLVYGNDFSHAPTNGIEATFSRNVFANNLVLECWHGIWGGYSYDSKVIGNLFGYNAQSIAWEHGQNNLIDRNLFFSDNEGIALWMNASQDPNWGYPKHRDTKSHSYQIVGNTFSDIATNAINLKDTDSVTLSSNKFLSCKSILKESGVNRQLHQKDNQYSLTRRGELLSVGESLPTAEGHPRPPTMKPSGNPVEPFDTRLEAYLDRFVLPWFPMGAPISMEMEDYQTAGTPFAPKTLDDRADRFLKPGSLRGRRYILVDEWGPYDFKSPIIWPRGDKPQSVDQAGRVPEQARSTVRIFEVLGPSGKWKVVSTRGVSSVSASEGTIPAVIEATLDPARGTDIQINLEFQGEAITTRLGEQVPAGTPFAFGYRDFFVPINWNVRWFAWDDTTDPRTHAAEFDRLLAKTPIKQEQVQKLEYTWPGAIGPDLPADHFATLADGDFEIAPGDYELKVTTDDGMRAWVDGKLVIADAWKYQGPTAYTAKLSLGGKHHIRIEHFEIDGYSTLQAKIVEAGR